MACEPSTSWVYGWRCRPTSRSLLLRDAESDRFLPIWIGAVEATAIAFAQQGVSTRAATHSHDLLRDVLTSLGRSTSGHRRPAGRDLLRRARVRQRGDRLRPSIGCDRPGSARTGSPLFAADHVLDEATDRDAGGGWGRGRGRRGQAEVEAFREFLDHVTPEGFRRRQPAMIKCQPGVWDICADSPGVSVALARQTPKLGHVAGSQYSRGEP